MYERDDRTDFQKLEPLGECSAGLRLHWDCTIDLIHKWWVQRVLASRKDNRHDGVRYRRLAWDILNKFYREPFDRGDPSWGYYAEFFAIWPERLPLGRSGMTLDELLRKVCETVTAKEVA